VAAGDAAALALGRAQGTPLVGRPFELSVPVTLDAPSEALPECIEADVYYGDTRLPRNRVTTQMQPAPNGATVRVRAEPAVNEPVVTVYVQLGCVNRYTRRIVLFSEQPDPESDRLAEVRARQAVQALPAVPPAAAASGSGTAPAAPVARSSRPVSEGARAPGATPRTTERPVAAAAAPAQDTASRPATRTARRNAQEAVRAEPQPRLKLEPMNPSAAIDPRLRMATGLSDPGATTNEQRAMAAALWKALNAQPDELLRDSRRLQELENSVRSMRQAIQRNETALTEVRGQLQQAQRERYLNPLVFGLGALALACAAAALWFRRRSRQPVAQWWSGSGAPLESEEQPERTLLKPDPRDDWKWSARPLAGKAGPSVDREPQAGARRAASGTAAPEFRPSEPPRSSGFSSSVGSEFPTSMLGARTLKAEELHDVQQEADFFVSLGEYDRAVDVLRSHIAGNPETSAVAWLDLMDIFHMLGRRAEYDETRREFQSLFNAQVPAYDQYSEAMPGLEDYPAAIQRICALWPHPRVLEVIEESIFRGPQHEGLQAFSLEAYRDLLMLHHVGTEALLESGENEPVRLPFEGATTGGGAGTHAPTFAATSISPLSAGATAGPDTIDEEPQARIDPLPEIDLDIDLDRLGADEPTVAGVSTESAQQADDGNVLDFDLPDIDISAYTTKKTRDK
jgi:hypothetical protein